MEQLNATQILKKNIALLIRRADTDDDFTPQQQQHLSVKKIKEITDLVRAIIFPTYFGNTVTYQPSSEYSIGVNMERLYHLLSEQISLSLGFNNSANKAETKNKAEQLSLEFIDNIPELKRLISTDVKATYDTDPAAHSYSEVIFSYPAIRALLNHRVAHKLLRLGIPVLPRIISELAHSETGIDIHPGATIGEYFSIDHGTGVVIGETTVIGNHVTLYQGVTLGSIRFTYNEQGIPVNQPRHPVIEDNVVIYANANVLGRITIGNGSIVGGNVWLTTSVPPNTKITQQKAVENTFTGGLGI
jgi:serine O-acetyltransferase